MGAAVVGGADGAGVTVGPAVVGCTEYEGGFVITDSDYAASLAGQGMAGFAMAAILIISMVLMILVYIVSAICGAIFCKCCNQAYKPRKFKKRDLLINKFVMLGFCVVTAVGCFIVFA